MRLERRSGLHLSRHQMSDLAPLTLPDGSMWPELVARRVAGKECAVYIVRGDDLKVAAWALVYHTPNLGGYDFHVFVAHEHRRKGIGTLLHDRAVEDHGVVRTFSPDDGARKFWAALTSGERPCKVTA